MPSITQPHSGVGAPPSASTMQLMIVMLRMPIKARQSYSSVTLAAVPLCMLSATRTHACTPVAPIELPLTANHTSPSPVGRHASSDSVVYDGPSGGYASVMLLLSWLTYPR